MSRSGDAGTTWETINNGISPRDVGSSEIKNIAINSNGTIFIGYAKNFPSTLVYRSTDNGSNWVLAQTGIQGGEILGLTIDDSGYVYASTDWQGVYKSTNDGDSWFSIGNTTSASGGKLAFNSFGDLFLASWGGGVWKLPHGDTVWVNITGSIYPYVDCIFIGSNDYIYAAKNRSTDNGATWTSLNIPVNNVYSYAENSAGHLFCGTYNYGGGVFRSTDYGDTWEAINSGLPTQDVRCVAVDADDYLYAGPWGYSLYKTTTSTVTSAEDIRFTPANFYLEQNYPNPFNPTTKIKYTVPQDEKRETRNVTLKVYDILGNEIATLVNDYKPAGSYEVEFSGHSDEGQNLTSGVYFYRLQAGSFIETKKMVLLK
ncbi:MAG: T9SS type A sorting domain-containing protein [Ignavibacterium sp.]